MIDMVGSDCSGRVPGVLVQRGGPGKRLEQRIRHAPALS